MEYAAFLQAAQRGQPPPLALLHGPDEQLLDDALDVVVRGLFVDASELALGREILEGTDVSVEGVVRSALTLPFMTSRRLIVVRRAQALAAKGGEALTAYARDRHNRGGDDLAGCGCGDGRSPQRALMLTDARRDHPLTHRAARRCAHSRCCRPGDRNRG